MTFKQLAKVGFQKWTLEQCKWIARESKMEAIERKVALFVMKKKFNIAA